MKKYFLFVFVIIVISSNCFANGAAVADAVAGKYLSLISSNVDIKVENQVAIITTTQTFKNTLGTAAKINFIFPLFESSSATGLQFKVNGIWKTAVFSPRAQDTTVNPGGPGQQMNTNLKNFMGKTPLMFDVVDTIKADSVLIIKLTYVELLKYSNGIVEFTYPGDYKFIQSGNIPEQKYTFSLSSSRKIKNISCLNHNATFSLVNDYLCTSLLTLSNAPSDKNYVVRYELSSDELGLSGFSTSIADSLLPDDMGHGFFLFTAEPDSRPSTGTIKKIFSLVIDRSGSMSGTKILQAKTAANYIINNLNQGDLFNIISFSDGITSYKPSHVSFNDENKSGALDYISKLNATGGTDIAGALGITIPQFTKANDTTAKIIIFLTDGEPTSGITDTQGILKLVNDKVSQTDTNITIFCFGIGTGVNPQLLTLLSSQHKGLTEFLANDEVGTRISQFYNKIRNPVLLNTKISFSPDKIIDAFPAPLPNLYKGEQFLVSGRYKTGGDITVSLSGNAFGQPVFYSYKLNLSDTTNNKYQFLTKVWAKLKIENLLIKYYSLDTTSAQARQLKQFIKELSVSYGVLTPFTSLTGGVPTGLAEQQNNKTNKVDLTDFQLLGNYPNPFNPETKIVFSVRGFYSEYAIIRIYNMIGELVRTILVGINREGRYEALWNGKGESGNNLPSGNYIYTVTIGNKILAGKMQFLK